MSKNKVIRIVITVALVALTAVAVGLYVYGVAVNNEPPTKKSFQNLGYSVHLHQRSNQNA